MSTVHDAEQRYFDRLPKCNYCSDCIDKGEGEQCEECGFMHCTDHLTLSLANTKICFDCKSREKRNIQRIARSEPLDEIYGVAV